MDKDKVIELITEIYGLSGNMQFITIGVIQTMASEIHDMSQEIIDILIEDDEL